MSIAQTSREIKFTNQVGSYSAQLMPSDGDIFQIYKGEETTGYSVTPNLEVTQPRLMYACTSSRKLENNQATGQVTPEAVTWYVNGEQLVFSAGVSTNVFNGKAGHFKQIVPGSNSDYFGIQVVKNLATDFNLAPISIKGTAIFRYALNYDSIDAHYTIPVSKGTADTVRVTIAAGDEKNFVIREKGGSCILKAIAFNFDGEINPAGLTYKWEQLTSAGWNMLATTTQTLTVSGDIVDTNGIFRVTVFKSGTSLGVDAQHVMDASDPYDINPNPTPADETINNDAAEGQSGYNVTYNPQVVVRGTNQVVDGCTFAYYIHDAVGNQLGTSNVVTKDMCRQAGGNVSIDIFANKTV